MARVHLPALIEKCRRVYDLHRFSWMRDNKVFGWQNMDVRYGGMIARCERAIEYIEEYIFPVSEDFKAANIRPEDF